MSDTKQQIRTRDEIEALKENWYSDPCWDIECADGFEAHYDELKKYSDECKAEWDAAAERKIAIEAAKIDVSVSVYRELKHSKERSEGLKQEAKTLMIHYFQKAMGDLHGDCRAEIRNIVDAIVEAAVSQVKVELLKSRRF